MDNDILDVNVPPLSVVKVFDVSLADAPAAFLFLKLSDDNGREIATNEYFITKENDTYDWPKTTWVNTPITHYASYKMIDAMTTRECEVSYKLLDGDDYKHCAEESCYEVTVSNPTDKVILMLRLVAHDGDGQLICPAYWSDNYLMLAPHSSRMVTLHLPVPPQVLTIDH